MILTDPIYSPQKGRAVCAMQAARPFSVSDCMTSSGLWTFQQAWITAAVSLLTVL